MRAGPGERGAEDAAEAVDGVEAEHDAAAVGPLEADAEHVHRGVERADAEPEDGEDEGEDHHAVAVADAEEGEQREGLRPAQHLAGPHPLDQLFGDDAPGPGEHGDRGEEDGQEPVGYPVPVLDGGDTGDEQREGRALHEEAQGERDSAVPEACVDGGGSGHGGSVGALATSR